MEKRIKGKESAIPWFFHDKLKCYDWSLMHGFPVPEIYSSFNSPKEIELPVEKERFVLKPTRFSSTRGVMVLRRVDEQYYDAMSKRTYTVDEVIAKEVALHEKFPVKMNQWITEELVVDVNGNAVPIDYKAYSFRGKIALILVIDRNVRPTRVDWYDGDFAPLAPGVMTLNPKYVQEGSGIPPSNAAEIRDIASSVSRIVGTPFSRIDLYNSTRGPLLGEITLTPGGLYYGDHYQLSSAQEQLMGAMWDAAEADTDTLKDSIAFLLYSLRYRQLTPKQRAGVHKLFWNPQLARDLIA